MMSTTSIVTTLRPTMARRSNSSSAAAITTAKTQRPTTTAVALATAATTIRTSATTTLSAVDAIETMDDANASCYRQRCQSRVYHIASASSAATTITPPLKCEGVRWRCQMLLILIICNCIVSAFEPDFVFPLENVTVAQGRDATFTCVVNNLGGHRVSGESTPARVAWIKADAKAILAIHEHVITNNDRLSVTHNDYNTWTLVIRNVKMEDSGNYMCQVNTDPMKMQTAILEVVIPPDIVNEETSGDMMVPEGGSAKLVCRARGHPKPKITWRREDGREIIARNGAHQKTKALAVEGEMLTLSKVTRSEMGAYMCIASNGVPPSVSKRMKLQVHFHPLVQVPNQLVGAPVLTDVTLICNVEASPKAINYWQRENGEMIIAGDRYTLNEKENNMYAIEMVLHIKRLQTSDFGGYKCISKNSIGDTEGTIRLYEMERPGKKNQKDEDLNEVAKNEIVLKENRHEDSARNQNGRLYKDRNSDSDLYSGSSATMKATGRIHSYVIGVGGGIAGGSIKTLILTLLVTLLLTTTRTCTSLSWPYHRGDGGSRCGRDGSSGSKQRKGSRRRCSHCRAGVNKACHNTNSNSSSNSYNNNNRRQSISTQSQSEGATQMPSASKCCARRRPECHHLSDDGDDGEVTGRQQQQQQREKRPEQVAVCQCENSL